MATADICDLTEFFNVVCKCLRSGSVHLEYEGQAIVALLAKAFLHGATPASLPAGAFPRLVLARLDPTRERAGASLIDKENVNLNVKVDEG